VWIPALAAAGFRVLAPDLRGYGATDCPAEVESYGITSLTGDLVGLLDALGLEKAVFIGHDWGALVSWDLPSLHPNRIAGIACLNVPYRLFRSMPEDPITYLSRTKGEATYIVVFQQPGLADAALPQDPSAAFHGFLRAGGITRADLAAKPAQYRNLHFAVMATQGFPGSPFLPEEEVAVFANTFARTGFTGSLNYYRNVSRNYFLVKDKPERIDVPCLMIEVPNDHYMPDHLVAEMPRFIPDLEIVTLENCGHWSQQEHPEAVNRSLIDWLSRRFKWRPLVRGLAANLVLDATEDGVTSHPRQGWSRGAGAAGFLERVWQQSRLGQ
jgi:epoxide hydrolase A/B